MDPGVPLNGRRVGRNFTSGSRVYFVCRDGYDTVGAKVILCQDNGIWDSATPTCSPANSKQVTYCTIASSNLYLDTPNNSSFPEC